MTMEPGDVVLTLTGTPSGVGFALTPPRSLSPGDTFGVSIGGIGSIRGSEIDSHELAGRMSIARDVIARDVIARDVIARDVIAHGHHV